MKSIVSENIKRYVADRRKLLLLAVFAFFCGAETGKAQLANMSLFEYVLYVMSNHYYIIYFMLIAYFFFLFDGMCDETDLMRIRLKTVKKQFVCRVVCICIQTFIYVAVHFVLAAVIGVMRPGFGYSGGFRVTAIEGYYNETIDFILEYGNYMKSPLAACVVTALYMIIGLTFMAVLIYVLRNAAGKKAGLIAIGIMIADIMIGFKIGINEVFGLLFLNNYFIFHHALFGSGTMYLIAICCIEVVTVYAGFRVFRGRVANKAANEDVNKDVNRINREKSYIKQMNKIVYRSSVLILCGYLVVNLISAISLGNGRTTAADILFSNIAGYSDNNFYLFEFLKYILFFAVPLYFIGVMTERENKMCNTYVAVRCGYKNWKKQIGRSFDMYLVKYYISFLLLLVIATVTAGFVTGNGSMYERICEGICGSGLSGSVASEFMQYMNINEVQFGYLLLFATFIKFFELLYYKEIYMLIYGIVNNSVLSFLLAFSGYIIVLTIRVPGVSFGVSSLYNLAEKVACSGMARTFFVAAAILGIKIYLIKLCLIKIISKRRSR